VAGLVAKAQAKLDEAVDEDRAELIDLVETSGTARSAATSPALRWQGNS